MTNSSIVEGIVLITENLAATTIDVSMQGGMWKTFLFVFAFIGFVSLAYSVFNNMWKGVSLAIYGVIFIPAAIIVSLVNKKKRAERLKEWGEISKKLTGKNKIKFIFYLIIKIGIPLLIFIFMIKWLF